MVSPRTVAILAILCTGCGASFAVGWNGHKLLDGRHVPNHPLTLQLPAGTCLAQDMSGGHGTYYVVTCSPVEHDDGKWILWSADWPEPYGSHGPYAGVECGLNGKFWPPGADGMCHTEDAPK